MAYDVEGKWYGPDKVAHLLFVPALSGWVSAFSPADAGYAVIVAVVLAMIWEASNKWFVFNGEKGISALDTLAFLVGAGVSTGLAYMLQRGIAP